MNIDYFIPVAAVLANDAAKRLAIVNELKNALKGPMHLEQRDSKDAMWDHFELNAAINGLREIERGSKDTKQ